ncbi:dehydrogenase [Desulforapulum autotrophicum HRM2]|uniref:Dehydrogenase n=1 Tax=Desulforapulum autotrophicum (strain ATCC 43914 / DSM 3382 / VKM B-1955 / HRM2) TaxID=177437 RepID=C0QDX3_DESAH|nr:dihydrolipoyl dehydrogenase [Desulforapulum autotrophicum]ACN17394.1 dehydrogenase [Desulforapulum autotrophicum HRM2]
MTREVDVAIIGAGTAGLTAQEIVVEKTDNYVIIDDGPLGTTCARVGCMPSKALIAVADDFHKRLFFDEYGISGAKALRPVYSRIMARVRMLRDEFSGGVIHEMSPFMDKLIRKRARFIDPNTLDLGDERIRARRIIIATGSKPWIPERWQPYRDLIIDTDQFFELEDLPGKMAVFGLGPLGIELGQALHRLGVEIIAFSRRKTAGGLTDPDLQTYAFDHFSKEMNIKLGTADIRCKSESGVVVGCESGEWTVDRILLATGRRPNVQGLGLENLGVKLDDRGLPAFDPGTLQIKGLPVFLAGDVNGQKPILHEAADDGNIAGYNATADTTSCFKKRIPLTITFSSPDIAIAGLSHRELTDLGVEFVTGNASWEKLGRARMILGKASGIARIYADKKDGRLLGAELMAPAGEHMAHLLSWAIGAGLTAADALAMPFYHPVPEEALRSALGQILKQTDDPPPDTPLEFCRKSSS